MADTLDFAPYLVAWVGRLAPGLAGRVRPWTAARTDQPPWCVYHEVSLRRVGSLKGPTGLACARVQVDVFGPDRDAVRAAADKVTGTRDAPGIDGYAGPVVSPLGTAWVECGRLLDGGAGDGYDPPADGSDRGYYRSSRDYEIWFQETLVG